jgi:hypothetical protein
VDDLDRAVAPRATRPTRPTTPLAASRRMPVPPPGPGGRRWLWALAALAVVAVAVVLLASAGGSDNKPASRKAAAGRTPAKHNASTQRSAAPAVPAGDPGRTLSDFYTSSIGGNIDHAWSISTDRLHAQVGGRESLQHQEADLKSIRFTRVTTTSKTASAATVSFADVAEHETFTDDCTGTASLVPGGPTGWLLDRIGVQCQRAGAPATAAPPPGQAKDRGKAPKGPKGKGGD